MKGEVEKQAHEDKRREKEGGIVWLSGEGEKEIGR